LGKVVGILPASGSASRMMGLPKFLLPVNENKNILEWHIDLMSECCDVIRISTQKKWMPILTDIAKKSNIELFEIEASTMPDAVNKMILNIDDRHIIGMPDIYVKNLDTNFYTKMSECTEDFGLALFDYYKNLSGMVGQVLLDDNDNVIDLVDKDISCMYNYMWGAITIKNISVENQNNHFGIQIKNMIKQNKIIKGIKIKGQYIDAGTFNGLQILYKGE
jgi:hypothetical protein